MVVLEPQIAVYATAVCFYSIGPLHKIYIFNVAPVQTHWISDLSSRCVSRSTELFSSTWTFDKGTFGGFIERRLPVLYCYRSWESEKDMEDIVLEIKVSLMSLHVKVKQIEINHIKISRN